MFDCHDRSPSACGGVATNTNVTIFRVSGWMNLGDESDCCSSNTGPLVSNPCFTQSYLNAVNLSNRGITSIAPLGLECYHFSAVGCRYRDNILETSFQAILLDGNELTAVPNMSVFGGACYVSLANNIIGGALLSNMFAGYSPTDGGAALLVDLQGNNITGTSHSTFSGYNSFDSAGSYLAVNMQNNSFNLNELANGTFAGILAYGHFAVNFESSNIGGMLTSGMFDGIEANVSGGMGVVNLRYNSISKLKAGVFTGFAQYSALNLYLDHNNVGALEAGTFSFGGSILNVSLDFNPVGSV